MQLSNDLAALIGFACEAILWAVNATLFLVSLIILKHQRLYDTLNNRVVYLNCLIFLCCTAHFALEFNHFYITLSTTGVTKYANETNQLLAADFLVSVIDLLGEFVLIYRCWMIWGKNYYVTILPLLTSISGLACIIAVVVILLGTDPSSPAPPADIVPFGLAGYTLPLCTNVMVTTLIVYRIWSTSRAVQDTSCQTGGGASHRAMMLIVESGALYLVFQLVYVVLFAISNPAIGIVAVMATQVYGIAPTLIIIRVGLGISSEHTSAVVLTTHVNWVGEDTAVCETGYINGDATSNGLKVTKEPDLSKPGKNEHDTGLEVFDIS